jgi:hypothetical protein
MTNQLEPMHDLTISMDGTLCYQTLHVGPHNDEIRLLQNIILVKPSFDGHGWRFNPLWPKNWGTR